MVFSLLLGVLLGAVGMALLARLSWLGCQIYCAAAVKARREADEVWRAIMRRRRTHHTEVLEVSFIKVGAIYALVAVAVGSLGTRKPVDITDATIVDPSGEDFGTIVTNVSVPNAETAEAAPTVYPFGFNPGAVDATGKIHIVTKDADGVVREKTSDVFTLQAADGGGGGGDETFDIELSLVVGTIQPE